MYLPECILCNLQYVGESEISFNIRLNNHWKNVGKPKAIPSCAHFRKEVHNFIQHTKFTFIEQLSETKNVNKATLKLRINFRKDF